VPASVARPTFHRRRSVAAVAARLATALVAAGLSCHAAPPPTTTHLPIARPAPATTRVLRGPFEVEARRASVGHPVPPPPPPPAAAPIRDVAGVSFYVDDRKSIADPRLQAENQLALAPLRRFVAEVTALADGWVVSLPADARYARLAAGALATWAGAGALLGVVNPQGAYEREWTLGSLALAYLKLSSAPGIPAEQRAHIERWLCALATAVRPPYERMDRRSSANNHAYWTGLAVAASGVACQDQGHFDWGIARARIGLAEVGPDGLLPLELARGRLALHYHVFALAPLVMLAELAVRNGVSLYEERDHALRRLAERVTAGLAEPASFEALTGLPQERVTVPPRAVDLAWAEPYAARFPAPRLAEWLAAARPLHDVRLGGDLTAAFARAPAAPR
jgi:poly(beta-D-mannuronate) lyase